MLMINIVESHLLKHIWKGLDLYREHALLGEQLLYHRDRTLDVMHVGKDIGGSNRSGFAVSPEYLIHCVLSEERVHGLYPGALCNLGKVRRRLDAHHSRTERLEPLQQEAVIAPDIHNKVPWRERSYPGHFLGKDAEVLLKCLCGGCDIDVVHEHHLRGHHFGELDQAALGAEGQLKRITRLRTRKILRLEEVVREGKGSQGEKLLWRRMVANTAAHGLADLAWPL